jgi:hypothetical protein
VTPRGERVTCLVRSREDVMNLESKWLEDFSALAATRSFSQAAERRFVTQPAFSPDPQP